MQILLRKLVGWKVTGGFLSGNFLRRLCDLPSAARTHFLKLFDWRSHRWNFQQIGIIYPGRIDNKRCSLSSSLGFSLALSLLSLEQQWWHLVGGELDLPRLINDHNRHGWRVLLLKIPGHWGTLFNDFRSRNIDDFPFLRVMSGLWGFLKINFLQWLKTLAKHARIWGI